MPTVIPQGYESTLGLYETQKAIGLIKQVFLAKLCSALHLKRVTAPLFVDPALGLNDDLNGVERPVAFDIPAGTAPRRWCTRWRNGSALRCTSMIFSPATGLWQT